MKTEGKPSGIQNNLKLSKSTALQCDETTQTYMPYDPNPIGFGSHGHVIVVSSQFLISIVVLHSSNIWQHGIPLQRRIRCPGSSSFADVGQGGQTWFQHYICVCLTSPTAINNHKCTNNHNQQSQSTINHEQGERGPFWSPPVSPLSPMQAWHWYGEEHLQVEYSFVCGLQCSKISKRRHWVPLARASK